MQDNNKSDKIKYIYQGGLIVMSENNVTAAELLNLGLQVATKADLSEHKQDMRDRLSRMDTRLDKITDKVDGIDDKVDDLKSDMSKVLDYIDSQQNKYQLKWTKSATLATIVGVIATIAAYFIK